MKTKGNQSVATATAIMGSLNWDKFTPAQLQLIQRDAQHGQLGHFLQDWLEGSGWLNETRLLIELGYDVNHVFKRLTPEIDETDPTINWERGSIRFLPMMETGSAPFAVHYKHILSQTFGLNIYIGLQSLKFLAESDRFRSSLFPSQGTCKRIFAPKSAYQTKDGQRYVPALHLDDLSIKPFSFRSILGQEDYTIYRR